MECLLPREGPIDPDQYLGVFSTDAWGRLNVAKWYAILKNGVERGDTLVYR